MWYMTSYNLGPLEQEIMDCLWSKKVLSVSQVQKRLRNKKSVAYTTIMTVMTRLVAKDFLTRRLVGKAYFYSPKKTKDQTTKKVIKKVVNSLIDQYGKEAVTAFTDELKKHR